jgi:hypothetical protein
MLNPGIEPNGTLASMTSRTAHQRLGCIVVEDQIEFALLGSV